MAMVINTNMGAINASRILDGTQKEQGTAMERLTSGLRINKAADDAAGLAVVTGMTTQIRGTDQAIRNANDGASLLQTMDGATEEVVNMLQRMRELGVQSLNETYSADNRTQMDAEFQQLSTEITRIANTTQFNETGLMSATTSVGLHVGWQTGAENKIAVSTIDFTGLTALTTNIITTANASSAITSIDANLGSIKNVRANWGAMQNRLDYTVSNLANVNENMNAARSQIQDADYARESSQLARIQVLQQAGMAMLGQANQQSQNV
ncbi:MAG: flagellin FliC, partial [Thiomicrospira sp.]|uniref:flagellin N-terminal helical domain-containing protein n=1 Tax=Thiomicrospira sp. TaxID=935 RepID=UPI0019E45D53